jgi:hypothetical protein
VSGCVDRAPSELLCLGTNDVVKKAMDMCYCLITIGGFIWLLVFPPVLEELITMLLLIYHSTPTTQPEI